MSVVLALSGASGALAAKLFIERCKEPVVLVASEWGRKTYATEVEPFESLAEMASEVYSDRDLAAAIASGSVKTKGMAVLPCSCNTLAHIANGFCNTLILRAAHCHLKEKRPLILCVRETPWTQIVCENSTRATSAGATVMPFSPPYYMFHEMDPQAVTMQMLFEAYVDRVLAALGQPLESDWSSVK